MFFLNFFVAQPERVGAVACTCLVVGVILTLASRGGGSSRGWSLLAVSVAWGLCAVWEWLARTSRWNIRPDALLIYPVLLVVTLAALVLTIRWRR